MEYFGLKITVVCFQNHTDFLKIDISFEKNTMKNNIALKFFENERGFQPDDRFPKHKKGSGSWSPSSLYGTRFTWLIECIIILRAYVCYFDFYTSEMADFFPQSYGHKHEIWQKPIFLLIDGSFIYCITYKMKTDYYAEFLFVAIKWLKLSIIIVFILLFKFKISYI